MEIVKADNLVKYYGSGDSLVKAVDHVGLSVRKGEFVAVVGTSGSGKTTLLNLLGGLDYADEGTVLVDGQDITRMKEEELTVFRRRNIGFVFQSYNLVTVLNVEKNITLPIRLDGNRVDEEYIGGITSALGISDKRKAFPNQLSGGQQQRVAIARAIAGKPSVILADEPTGNLDPQTAEEIMNLLAEINERGTTVLVVTHNKEIVNSMKKRVVTMHEGVIVSDEKEGGYHEA